MTGRGGLGRTAEQQGRGGLGRTAEQQGRGGLGRTAEQQGHPDIDIVAVTGGATESELAAVARALKELVDDERRNRARSVWRRASRAQGRRLGMFDYRDRFAAADAWRLSTRFPFGGREYPGRWGRGDSK